MAKLIKLGNVFPFYNHLVFDVRLRKLSPQFAEDYRNGTLYGYHSITVVAHLLHGFIICHQIIWANCD